MRAEPSEGLQSDDSADPDSCPLLSANILSVELGTQVKGEEDGPYDGERPDVSVKAERQRAQQLGMLNLGVVDEGRHDGRWGVKDGRISILGGICRMSTI